jgi:hypothetical protein
MSDDPHPGPPGRPPPANRVVISSDRLPAAAYIILTLALILAASPAAACHRFSVWRYPFPQRCGRFASREVVPAPAPHPAPTPLPAEDEDRTWYVEIVIPPPDDGGRAAGLEKLKALTQ